MYARESAHDAWDENANLGDLHDAIGPFQPPTDEQKRAAALTVAETALAQHWSLGALGQVLDALGIGESRPANPDSHEWLGMER